MYCVKLAEFYYATDANTHKTILDLQENYKWLIMCFSTKKYLIRWLAKKQFSVSTKPYRKIIILLKTFSIIIGNGFNDKTAKTIWKLQLKTILETYGSSFFIAITKWYRCVRQKHLSSSSKWNIWDSRFYKRYWLSPTIKVISVYFNYLHVHTYQRFK